MITIDEWLDHFNVQPNSDGCAEVRTCLQCPFGRTNGNGECGRLCRVMGFDNAVLFLYNKYNLPRKLDMI